MLALLFASVSQGSTAEKPTTMTSGSTRDQQLSAALDHLEHKALLDAAENFVERMEAIDMLEFQLLGATDPTASPTLQRAEALKQRLDETNNRLFSTLRTAVRANERAFVKQTLQAAAQQIPDDPEESDDLGYDALDMLINGLLEIDFVPEEAAELETDLVFYQPTPARIILKLIDILRPTADDVLYDLGSGLGHVPILVNLLTGIRTRGVELEESYCRYANACVQALALTDVTFVQADARSADFSEATIFYLYTPFQGAVLQQVLGRLAKEAEQRPIRVCTYGPCTLPVALQSWLKPIYRTGNREGSFAIFGSA